MSPAQPHAASPRRRITVAHHLVIGLRLAAGRDVVVKARPWQERLIGCAQVQHGLSVGGFPAPQLLVAPERLGQFGVGAGRWR
jgi:hypothetical protein